MEREETIVGIKVPDEHVRSWMEGFQKAGLSNEEIDKVMTNLNDTWAKMRFGVLFEEFEKMVLEDFKKMIGREFTDDQKESLRKGILDFLRTRTEEEIYSMTAEAKAERRAQG